MATATNGRYQLGFIGAGNVSRLHADAARHESIPIAGFYDVDPDRAKAAAERYQAELATDDLAELLDREEIPVIVVAAPNVHHKAMAVAALEAGKNVILEKPMGLTVAECDEIIGAVNRTGRRLQLGFVSRYSPVVTAARKQIDAGRVGPIYHAKATLLRRRGIPGLGRWFTTKRIAGGGVLMDLGVHLIDLVLHYADRPKPERISAACTNHFGKPIGQYVYEEMWAGPPDPEGTFDVEDAAEAFIRFRNGMTMQLSVAWASHLPEAAMREQIVLFGEKGALAAETWGGRLLLGRNDEQSGQMIDVTPVRPPGDPWTTAWRAQHRHCREIFTTKDAATTATSEHGRQVQAIVDGIYASSEAGKEVELES